MRHEDGVDEPASEQQQSAYAEQMLIEVREEVTRADGKAGMLLSAVLVAASVIGGGALAGDLSPHAISNKWEWMFWIGAAAWAAAAVLLALSAFPRTGTPSDRRHLTYFGHVVLHESVDDLRESLSGVASDPLRRTTDQLFHVSGVLVAKYRNIQRAFWALGTGALLLSLVVLLELLSCLD